MTRPLPSRAPLDERGIALRRQMLHTLWQAGRGHLPSAFSLTEILRVLYDNVLHVRPQEPWWPQRDRCILSKGHGCLALYAILADKGFFPQEDMQTFCRFDAHLGGHPERGHTPGVEASTGSLGHGPSLAVGMALALRMDNKDARVFAICGDGETNEGSVWEAMLSAAKHKLDRLTVIIDHNKLQSWGTVDEILPLAPYADKWRAFGASVAEVDGHNVSELQRVFAALPLDKDRPSVIIAHTVKGRGISTIENNPGWHHKTRVSDAEYQDLLQALEQQS